MVLVLNLKKEVTMGTLDNMRDQANDIMDDPDARDKIQRIADEHGMSIEDAKTHYLQQKDQ
jgi:hypothetical protein